MVDESVGDLASIETMEREGTRSEGDRFWHRQGTGGVKD
jgi:hypothetical protein